MQDHKNFWDRNAGLYDCFMRKDRAAYEKIYELIRPVVKDKTVLELATGTGLIAKHIVKVAARIEATLKHLMNYGNEKFKVSFPFHKKHEENEGAAQESKQE